MEFQLRSELATRTTQIQELVLAYSEVEHESEIRLGHVQLLGRVWSDTVSASSVALRTLWQHIATPGAVDQQLVRKAVMSAVVQQEEAQKVLARAGLQQLALGAASAAANSSALLQTLDSLPDPLRQQERGMFASAIRELQSALVAAGEDRQAAEQAVEDVTSRLSDALADIDALSSREAAANAAASETRLLLADTEEVGRRQRERIASMAAAAAEPLPPSYDGVLIGDRVFGVVDVIDLQRTVDTLRLQCDEMRSAVAEAAAASAAATVSAAVADLEASTGRPLPRSPGRLASPSSGVTTTPQHPHSRYQLAASGAGRSESPFMSNSSSADASTAALVAAISQESAQYLTRAVAAEAILAESAQDRKAYNAEHAAVIADLRSRVSTAEATAGLLTRTAASLRHELQLAQDKYAAQGGVVEMLRQELADVHSRLATLGAAKSDMARKAAAALREVEGQVAALTSAVQQMKQGQAKARSAGVS